MWIIIENGEVFEGDEVQLAKKFGLNDKRPNEVVTELFIQEMCSLEQWKFKVYSKKEHSWN